VSSGIVYIRRRHINDKGDKMTQDIEGLVSSISINQVLVAILEEYGKLTVPTLKFLDAKTSEKELVIDYNEEDPSFTFSLRETKPNLNATIDEERIEQ
jgi:hypothetical protein